jgi:hypothetical protein
VLRRDLSHPTPKHKKHEGALPVVEFLKPIFSIVFVAGRGRPAEYFAGAY